jgi:transcriptional regulator with XRE-family HTH domain
MARRGLVSQFCLQLAFGHIVCRHRTERRFSQEKFAAKARISRTYMSEIERGATMVSLEAIARAAKALALSMSALLQHVEELR